MKNIYRKCAVIVTGTTVSLLLSGKVEAANFTFTKIVDNSESFSDITFDSRIPFETIALNDNGIIAFTGTLDGGGEGIFTSSGGSITTIINSSSDSYNRVVINNNNTVAFTATKKIPPHSLELTDTLFIGSGNSVTPVFNDSVLKDFSIDYLAINDSNTVAFLGNPTRHSSTGGVFTLYDNSLTKITDATNSFDFFRNVDINDNGTVTFEAVLDNRDTSIVTNLGGSLTTIVDVSGSFQFVGPSYINNNNTIVFYGSMDNGNFGIFTIDSDGHISSIADRSSSFSFNSDSIYPAINDSGTVAFVAFLDDDVSGIFIGDDPVADKVIATGDSLFGSTVASIGSKQLNNFGQIAFRVQLANGTKAIVRADPVSTSEVSIPESTSVLSLLGMGAVGFLIKFFRLFS